VLGQGVEFQPTFDFLEGSLLTLLITASASPEAIRDRGNCHLSVFQSVLPYLPGFSQKVSRSRQQEKPNSVSKKLFNFRGSA
jgi:hypothetical protein